MTAEVDAGLDEGVSTVRPEEDFLFHLYRGSELLDDNRLIEAQSELEYALTLQPKDARTLGLLATVYFRNRFHARAIATYKTLLAERPNDPTLRLNLSLCHLKTGQAEAARSLLESLVAEDVSDARAWGYLAIALGRLGYVEQAREAFERAGQEDLAWRMVERGASKPRARRSAAPRSGQDRGAHDGLEPRGRSNGHVFEPIDGGVLRYELVQGEPTDPLVAVPPPPAATELADAPRPRHDTLAWGTHVPGGASAERPSRSWGAPLPLGNFIEDTRVERLGDAHGLTTMGTHLARVDLDRELSPAGFGFRLDALRSYHGVLSKDLLPRQTRTASPPVDEAGETFGGIGTPFGSMAPPGQLLLGPRSGMRVHAFTLEDELVFFRENVVLGFELSLAYENGKLPLGGATESVAIVQLKGHGALLLEVAGELVAVDVKAGGVTVRRDVVIGWAGRLLPTAVQPSEAPGGQRGLIGFSGEGTVLVSAR